jgi:hypothetical protein
MLIRKAVRMILRGFVIQVLVWTEGNGRLESDVMLTKTRIGGQWLLDHSYHDCQTAGQIDMAPLWVIDQARIQMEESDAHAVKSGRAIISLPCRNPAV